MTHLTHAHHTRSQTHNHAHTRLSFSTRKRAGTRTHEPNKLRRMAQGAKTHTKTKVYFETVQPIGPHSDLSSQSVTIHVGDGESPVSTGKLEYLHSGCSVTTIVEGTQSCLNLPFAATIKQLTISQPNGPVYANSTDTWASSPFDLNPNQYATGSWVTGAATAIGQGNQTNTVVNIPVQDRLFLKHADLMYMISNCGTVPLFIDCMWYLPKKDLVADGQQYNDYLIGNQAVSGNFTPSGFVATADDPWNVWSKALNVRSFGQGFSLPSTGISGQNAPIAGAITPNDYGMSPLSERGFRNMFRLIKRTTLTLQSGECHKILAKVHFNKMLDRETLKLLSLNGTNLKSGLTLCPLFIVRPGAVALATAVNGVPVTNSAQFATTGTGKVSVVHSGYYNFSSCAGKRLDLSRNQAGLIHGTYGYGTLGNVKEELINILDTVASTVDE